MEENENYEPRHVFAGPKATRDENAFAINDVSLRHIKRD